MADTSTLKRVSEYAISCVERDLGISLSRKKVVIGIKNREKTFDGVSVDNSVVVKVINHSGNTAGGNLPSAKIRSTYADCFFLSLTNAKQKILTFTNQEFFEIFQNNSDGLLEDIKLRYIELPDEYRKIAERVTKQASGEMTG